MFKIFKINKSKLMGGVWGFISGLYISGSIFIDAMAQNDKSSAFMSFWEILVFLPGFIINIFSKAFVLLFEYLITLNIIHPKILVVIILILLPVLFSILIGMLLGSLVSRFWNNFQNK